jgi:hypothetical protein
MGRNAQVVEGGGLSAAAIIVGFVELHGMLA